MRTARRLRVGQARARAEARRLGMEVRLGRSQLALSREQLARRAGVSASTVERIEGGDPAAQIDTLAAITTAAGLELAVRVFPGPTPRLRDTGQLTIAQALTAVAADAWQPQLEVPAGEHGRAADLVLYGPREVLHFEIERTLVDFQAQFRSADRKRLSLATGEARPVRLVIAVADTERNRRAVLPHADLITDRLPARSRAILAALRGEGLLGRDGVLWVRARRPPQGVPGRVGRRGPGP